ncbi:secondary thiamine-phosphate synthase enzyme YjbQ [Candidatus Oleimmundimicrobium sp.]|uniref:secondary thiamine-phosphate synthase enzyme YjbQ n=1 Tax=Candidatus Oleimmundimicrobium sp. TaxID=3060597 RepID=UPI0027242E00|nr:secondary thiamine-phosphate synthase enzyme YjbQ [Candidatus Oleimmundimicrobium sp.]MDO8885319.1 secondary thiamine-phosphate synthase enzyme YjbQ [Candidatus Oleimmundimicrobium sp.]
MVVGREICFLTKGNVDIVDLTQQIETVVKESGISNGMVNIFVPGATGSITTIECEAGLLDDFKNIIEELIPQNHHYYKHNNDLGGQNAHSHLRASLLGPSLTVPIVDKELTLGAWQQIIFIDFDDQPRNRCLKLQLIGE